MNGWTCPRCGHQIEPHQGGNFIEEAAQHMHDHAIEDYAMTTKVETVGDFYAIAPEIISTTPTPQADTVLNWAGENFTVQQRFSDAKHDALIEVLNVLESAMAGAWTYSEVEAFLEAEFVDVLVPAVEDVDQDDE